VIRAGLLALILTGPAGAEGLCPAAWDRVVAAFGPVGAVRGQVGQDGDWCVVDGLVLDLEGPYLPDWHADRLRFRGSALGWLVEGAGSPDSLEIGVEGLRLVVQTGNAQLDWLYAAQARANTIRAQATLGWDPAEKVLRLEGLSIDFPGDNLVDLSAVVRGVDLSSTGAMQMSLTGFAVTEADLAVTMHGLFEGWLLMPLGSALLPVEGDMDVAAEGVRADLLAGVAALPETVVPPDGKAALRALILDLPNPAGDLTVSLRSEAGIGPARLAPWVMTAGSGTSAGAATVLEGATVDVGWTPAEAP
jgi:hypothetical protein